MSRPQLLAPLFLLALLPAPVLADAQLAPPGVCARIGEMPELGPLVGGGGPAIAEIDVAAGGGDDEGQDAASSDASGAPGAMPVVDPGAGLPGAVTALFSPVDVAGAGPGAAGLPLPLSAGFGGPDPCEGPARCLPSSALPPVAVGGPPTGTGVTEPGPDLGLDAPGVSR